MKINIFPPAIIKTDDSLTVNGRAKACFIAIHPDAPESTLPHELCHVWQWWTITVLTVTIAYLLNQPLLYMLSPSVDLLLSLIPHYRLLRECMAHAVSAKYKENPERYINSQSWYMVSEESSYTALHRFRPQAAEKLMRWFYNLLTSPS